MQCVLWLAKFESVTHVHRECGWKFQKISMALDSEGWMVALASMITGHDTFGVFFVDM